jgi:hypothetical protein
MSLEKMVQGKFDKGDVVFAASRICKNAAAEITIPNAPNQHQFTYAQLYTLLSTYNTSHNISYVYI